MRSDAVAGYVGHLHGSPDRGRPVAPTAARLLAVATAATGAAYAALTVVAAVWGSLSLTRPRGRPSRASITVRQALGGALAPPRGDQPLWHPTVEVTASSMTGSDGVVEVAGVAAAVPGRWGLEWYDDDRDRGYAQLGDVLRVRVDDRAPGHRVVARQARVLTGDLGALSATRAAAADAMLCAYGWPDDLDVLRRGLARDGVCAAVDEVGIASTGGLFPATLIEPDGRRRTDAGDTWVIAVHGRGSRRAQIYRMAGLLARHGVTTLAITYRGDDGTPLSDGRSTLGSSEWLEVESAVGYALSRGARRVVLYCFSMGGAIGTAFLRRSPLSPAVTALVLDAPVLDWGPVLSLVAARLRLPRPAVPLTMLLVRLLVGADFTLVNRLLPPQPSEHPGRRPTLLVHGTDDPVVPVCSSDMLAEAEPETIRYLRVDGAGHTTAYNYAPALYESYLSAFVTEAIAAAPAPTFLYVANSTAAVP